MRLCPRCETRGVLPAAFDEVIAAGRAQTRGGEWCPAPHACRCGCEDLLRTFFMRGMGLTDHHCRMASRWCTGSLAKGCMGGHMDSSIHGGATVAVPGPDLRRKNSLQASSMGQRTPNWASRKPGKGLHGLAQHQQHPWQAHVFKTP